ncbi:AAA family ATPase [Bacillus cereus]|uniref:AAA family ATPase n=1 Tax=Bacillus cereus TaxID=1396 RepID=UPI000B4B36A8|nr:AAA family ATPase [Bacillus cereus]
MQISKSKQELLNALKGNHPLIYIVSEDERPVIETIEHFIAGSGEPYKFLSWDFNKKAKNLSSGKSWVNVKKQNGKEVQSTITIQQSITHIIDRKENSIQLFLDANKRLEFGDLKVKETLIRSLKDFAYESLFPFSEGFNYTPYTSEDTPFKKSIIFVSPTLFVPKEIESLVHIINFDNPSREELINICTSFVDSRQLNLDKQKIDDIAQSLVGLTESQSMLAIRKSYHLNEQKDVSVKDIQNEKIQIIKKKGTLDFIDSNINKTDIGGFDELFNWISKRKLLLNEETKKKYNLSYPKGALLTGVQGCGKSLAVKVIANEFGIPLIRLDLGSIFGRWLGESEGNLRRALAIAEQMAPCVLWIDEIEKSLSVDGSNTHEVTKRIFGHFLTWMQENELPVFLTATANNIDQIPPEFLRKGRFDEIWFVDLPSYEERIEIFRVHWKNRNITFSEEELIVMAEQTDGYSGAEIEAIVKESVLSFLHAGTDKINLDVILKEKNKITPLSVINKPIIQSIRNWAVQNKVRPVSSKHRNLNTSIGFNRK